jgi:phage-related protein
MSGASKQAMVLKPVFWVGNSRETLREFPDSVQDEVGFALYLAQGGGKHFWAKPLQGLQRLSSLKILMGIRTAPFTPSSWRGLFTCCIAFKRSRSMASLHRKRKSI